MSSQGKSEEGISIVPGMVFLGPMDGVDHKKYYIIAGVSGDKCCVCSVIINSKINQFILNRQHLLDCQVKLTPQKNSFLDHDSYANCAQPWMISSQKMEVEQFQYISMILEDDLDNIIETVKYSGTLTEEEMDLYFL